MVKTLDRELLSRAIAGVKNLTFQAYMVSALWGKLFGALVWSLITPWSVVRSTEFLTFMSSKARVTRWEWPFCTCLQPTHYPKSNFWEKVFRCCTFPTNRIKSHKKSTLATQYQHSVITMQRYRIHISDLDTKRNAIGYPTEQVLSRFLLKATLLAILLNRCSTGLLWQHLEHARKQGYKVKNTSLLQQTCFRENEN